jgi:hypothetical protein
LCIVINKRCRSLPENIQFYCNQLFIIIRPFCSIPTHVFPDAHAYIFNRTIQYDERVYLRNVHDVLCLACMTRDAVQNEQIARSESCPVQEQAEYLFGKREMLVLEQESLFEHTLNRALSTSKQKTALHEKQRLSVPIQNRNDDIGVQRDRSGQSHRRAGFFPRPWGRGEVWSQQGIGKIFS